MKKRWLNDKQPDENGDITLIIENNSGRRLSTFKGKTMEEVADAQATALLQANRTIGRLKPDSGRVPLKMQPREITAADRLRMSTEITDPNKVVEIVDEIVTAKQGAAPAVVGQRFSEFDQEAADAYYRSEVDAFKADNPDYFMSVNNQTQLFQALRSNGYDLTRNNLTIVYNQLLDEGKMDLGPAASDPTEDEEEDEEEVEAPPPQKPPPPQQQPTMISRRNHSSGLRNSDANASRPAPRPRVPLVTWDQLQRMSRAEYSERLRDPAFRRAVDALEIPAPAMATRR
jgi:hypothetical protein